MSMHLRETASLVGKAGVVAAVGVVAIHYWNAMFDYIWGHHSEGPTSPYPPASEDDR